MPELPEVETVRAGLDPVMTGRLIVRAQVNRPDLRFPLPDRMADRLTGARVLRLGRRSKYILADLSTGETLLIHLGMSGRMLVSQPPTLSLPIRGREAQDGNVATGGPLPLVERDGVGGFHFTHPAPEKHDHVVLEMEGGARVTFNDARRFGAMDLMPTDGAAGHRLLRDLGPEPLGNQFDGAYLAARFSGRTMPVKAALLDQRIVAGLGNIYVSEALHRAHVDPRRAAGTLSATEIAILVPAIRAVLDEAIAAGGSSLKDFRRADGELGYFQHSFRTYDRAGAPCAMPGCGGQIERIVQSGRSTYFCPLCQR